MALLTSRIPTERLHDLGQYYGWPAPYRRVWTGYSEKYPANYFLPEFLVTVLFWIVVFLIVFFLANRLNRNRRKGV